MAGNAVIGEAAIRAGCQCYFGYPITPQNELTEYMAENLGRKKGCTFIQAESELAAINMVYGASLAGVRTMTSSSSPGISLKQEGISYLAASELPAVIVNMSRGGSGAGQHLRLPVRLFPGHPRGRPWRLPHHSAGAFNRSGTGRSHPPGL